MRDIVAIDSIRSLTFYMLDQGIESDAEDLDKAPWEHCTSA